MKLLAIVASVICVGISFAFTALPVQLEWPCHPAGDIVPCSHRVHLYDYDMYGNTFPCGHWAHYHDVIPCVHYCF